MSCQCCNKPFTGAGGKDARKPAILPCICRLCKGCVSEEEAKVQQQQKEQPKKMIKGKGKGKAKNEEEKKYTPTPCINCKKLCNTPVAELLLDTVLMRKVNGGGGPAAAAVPLCDHCEEDAATKFCKDCLKCKFSCDGCFTTSHKSAKKQGHSTVLIHEHLASAPAHAAGGGSAAAAERTTKAEGEGESKEGGGEEVPANTLH